MQVCFPFMTLQQSEPTVSSFDLWRANSRTISGSLTSSKTLHSLISLIEIYYIKICTFFFLSFKNILRQPAPSPLSLLNWGVTCCINYIHHELCVLTQSSVTCTVVTTRRHFWVWATWKYLSSTPQYLKRRGSLLAHWYINVEHNLIALFCCSDITIQTIPTEISKEIH